MPDQGQMAADRLPHTLPVVSPPYPPPPWPLPGARLLKVTYETDKETVLRWLPTSLGRPIPPYAHIIVARFPETPVGPFSLAVQALGCRARFLVRAYSLQAITDSPTALVALREMWGFPCLLGSIALKEGEGEVEARLEVGGEPVCTAALRGGTPIDAELVRFDPYLNLRLTPSVQEGQPPPYLALAQIDPHYEVKRALRGKAEVSFPRPTEGAPWHLLPFLAPVVAVWAEADTELPFARFVLPY
nr:acetoacetate decarboxylase (ADC) [uncultured bacterium]